MTRLLKSRPSSEPTGWKSMSEDQPRTYHGCGEKLVLAHPEPLVFSTFHKTSWHAGCWFVELRKAAV
jgi:hypothetical protein